MALRMRVGQIIELELNGLAAGGRAVGRSDGRVVFVSGGAPGDRAQVELQAVRRRHGEGRVVKVLKPGPGRRPPDCPAFGDCGGCQWLHLKEDVQSEAKENLILSAFSRIGKFEVRGWDGIKPVSPEGSLSYRSRAVLRGESDGRDVKIGFYATGTHRVVPIPGHCRVLHPELDRLVVDLSGRAWPKGAFQLDLAVGEAGPVHVTLRPHGDWGAYASVVRDLPFQVLDGRGRVVTSGGPEFRISYKLEADGEVLEISSRPGSFGQVHRRQNRALVEAVLEMSAVRQGESVLDLYCGIGNLSLPLAVRGGQVVGVEVSGRAVADAARNGSANRLSGCRFVTADVPAYLARGSASRPDLVVLNPPRTGAADAIEGILRTRASRIVYVSCDPATLARDASRLMSGGYHPARAVGVDMFPQTAHVEIVMLLESSAPR